MSVGGASATGSLSSLCRAGRSTRR